MSPPFTLDRATTADLAEILALEYASFPTFVREVLMGCSSEADLPRAVEHAVSKQGATAAAATSGDPHDIWIKVTDNATGKIIAASNWKVHLNAWYSAEVSDDKPLPWLTPEQAQQAKETLDGMNEKRHRANPGGYWGCDLADHLFLPGWVEASEQGSALYATFGFYEYERTESDLLPGVNMKRHPRAKGIEGGKAAPAPAQAQAASAA
ncbi:hypothetical protein DV735_g5445, partial [Chaetothyriales sp. CBS 134920]